MFAYHKLRASKNLNYISCVYVKIIELVVVSNILVEFAEVTKMHFFMK